MYSFFRTTDLSKMVFYFLCNHWSSKVYTCFVKIVVLVTKSTTKLVLQFLDFSAILDGFYKIRHKGSKSDFWFYEQVPGFHGRPLGGNHLLHPGCGQQRGSPESGQGRVGIGRGWWGTHLGSIWGVGGGGRCSGERARRWQAMAAAGSFAPASRQPGLDHTQLGKLQAVLVEVWAGLVGGDEGRKVGLTVRPSLADRGGSGERQRRARQTSSNY
jgi:hypothetical protein